ncbi:hypothetical protein [Citrobacter amalonaticus]
MMGILEKYWKPLVMMLLGGNQSDAINIRAFSRSRVTGYRWPVNEPRDNRLLPLMNGTSSVNES